MRCAFHLLPLFIQDLLNGHLDILAVWLHDLYGFTHRKFISLLDPVKAVPLSSDDPQISIFSDIGVIIINLGFLVRLSEIKTSGKLPVCAI